MRPALLKRTRRGRRRRRQSARARVCRAHGARLCVELELLQQVGVVRCGRQANALTRHGELDLDGGGAWPNVQRHLLTAEHPLRLAALRKRVALALIAVIVGVEAENLVPLALHRGRCRLDESLGRPRSIERRVRPRSLRGNLDAARILDRALQHLFERLVIIACKAPHGALRITHALGGAKESLHAIAIGSTGLDLGLAALSEALRFDELSGRLLAGELGKLILSRRAAHITCQQRDDGEERDRCLRERAAVQPPRLGRHCLLLLLLLPLPLLLLLLLSLLCGLLQCSLGWQPQG